MTRPRKYRLGLYEKAMPGGIGWEEKLSAARDAGFDFVELSVDETDEKLARLDRTEEMAALESAAQKTGTPVRTLCLSGHRRFPLGSRDAAVRGRGLEIMEKAVDLADRLGIRIIQLAGYDVYYEQGGEDTKALFRDGLRRAVETAARRGVLLGFETMETPFMDTVGKAMAWVDETASPYLGVYPDVGNLTNAAVLYGHVVTDDLRTGAGHVVAAHLKETRPGVYRDMDFGTGHTDYVSCVRCLWEMGVRLFTGEFWHRQGVDWRKRLADASTFLREKIEAATGENRI